MVRTKKRKVSNSKLDLNAEERLKKLSTFVQKQNNSDATDDNENSDSAVEHYNETSNKAKLKEDIFGRLRDEQGNIIKNDNKYVPPHLRIRKSENSEKMERLNKQMKGFLNRLTESNMHSIAVEIERLYMSHSRNDTNYIYTKCIMDSLIVSVLSPQRIIIENALLISVLHANIGIEIGSHILEHLIMQLHKFLNEDVPVEDKRIDNIILLLSFMYYFKIFYAQIIYDILDRLVERFQEKDIELILLILKNIGFSLRKDNPAALKQFIFNVQKKSNEFPNLRENTRVKFMLDTLTAVKNNNTLKITQYDPTYVEHLKKIQKSFLRPGKYVTELKISLEDILNAEEKGRWWIVGSAWDDDKTMKSENKERNSCLFSFNEKILQLAKKQRMNTDTRRNIFCVLMTAEDYIDAFEKLMKLGLKGQQYQEIVHVLLHCMLKEKQYNPYYSFIAEQLCSVDRKYQLALQFSLWDKFKEINSLSDQRITNLAKFLSYLFLELKLPLSVLKVLHFAEMNKPMVKLIRQILLSILLNDNETSIVNVFSRIAKSNKLFVLREGLQLFLHHFILKNCNIKESCSEKMIEMLPERVELAVNAMRGSVNSVRDFNDF